MFELFFSLSLLEYRMMGTIFTVDERLIFFSSKNIDLLT